MKTINESMKTMNGNMKSMNETTDLLQTIKSRFVLGEAIPLNLSVGGYSFVEETHGIVLAQTGRSIVTQEDALQGTIKETYLVYSKGRIYRIMSFTISYTSTLSTIAASGADVESFINKEILLWEYSELKYLDHYDSCAIPALDKQIEMEDKCFEELPF